MPALNLDQHIARSYSMEPDPDPPVRASIMLVKSAHVRGFFSIQHWTALTSTKLKLPEACHASLSEDDQYRRAPSDGLDVLDVTYRTKTGPADPSSYPGCFITFLISSRIPGCVSPTCWIRVWVRWSLGVGLRTRGNNRGQLSCPIDRGLRMAHRRSRPS
jgi:hypothetical protein